MNARIFAAIAIGVAAGFTGTVQAQTFPSKAVRIVVPFPPGGAADITKVEDRLFTEGLIFMSHKPAIGTQWPLQEEPQLLANDKAGVPLAQAEVFA